MAHLHVKTPNGTQYSIDLDAVNTNEQSGFNQNSWMKLPSGLIFQWGKYLESTSVTDYRYFPIAFNNKCLSMINGYQIHFGVSVIAGGWSSNYFDNGSFPTEKERKDCFICGVGNDWDRPSYEDTWVLAIGY